MRKTRSSGATTRPRRCSSSTRAPTLPADRQLSCASRPSSITSPRMKRRARARCGWGWRMGAWRRSSSFRTARRRPLLLARGHQQAERVETMRRDFVANSRTSCDAAHRAGGFLETYASSSRPAARARLHRHDARASARMHRIIEDLLGSRAGIRAAGPAERVRHRDAARASLGGRGCLPAAGTRSACAAAAPRSAGAEPEIASAFGNLLSNAVRYTPAGGRVTLAWDDGPEGASFSVEDSGVGIAPEHIPAAHRALLPRRSPAARASPAARGSGCHRQARARAAPGHSRSRAPGGRQPLQRALPREPHLPLETGFEVFSSER